MKQKTIFVCQECGAQSQKWLGRCPECGAWNSIVEERLTADAAPGGAAGDIAKRYSLAASAGPQLYADIDSVVAERLTTGIGEFDRVLGGGVVPGSLVLIGGEPGIGKSTLLLQAAAHFARTYGPVLYCSGEESEHQIKSRGERLGIARAPLYILAETCLERILEEIARLRPAFVIVDSIQTVFSLRFQSAPGRYAKRRPSSSLPPRGRTSRRFSSGTSRRMAASRGRRPSSTSSTPCCTSKGKNITRTASSGPSRTGSAP
jgi:DNA repair protein RadA/Sms